VNDFNLSANTASSTGSGLLAMPKHTDYLMMGALQVDDWTLFNQLMYDKIDTLANNPVEVIVKPKPRKPRLQNKDDSEVAAMCSMFRTKCGKQN
jgi:hypothetical protein